MYHISCFGHTTVVLNCGNVIRFSIMGFCFNLPQEGKSHAIRLLLQVEVRLDKNIVPLSYKVRAQTQIGRQPGRFPPSLRQWNVAWYNSAPWRMHCQCASYQGQIQVFLQAENYSEYNVYIM